MSLLTYEKLITCSPLFHVNMLAGWAGRKNLCHHVCVNELPKEENSLLLINLSDETLPLLEEAVCNNNCTGVLILSPKSCNLPSSITDFAEKIKKPIVALPNENMEQLFMRIHEIFSLHERKLLPLLKSDLATYWFELLSQDGIEHVMERLTMFLGQDIYLFTNKKKYIPLISSKYSDNDFKNLKRINANSDQKNLPISIVQNEKAKFFSYEIYNYREMVMGYLLFEIIGPLEDFQLHLLESTVPMFNFYYKQIEFTRQVHRKYKDQFLFDILHNNIDTESDLIELGRMMDIEFTSQPFVFSININGQQMITNETIMNIQQLLVDNKMKEFNIYSTYLNHQIVGIVCPTMGSSAVIGSSIFNEWMGNIQKLISDHNPHLQTVIGVGRKYESNIDIYKSFLESKIALQMEIQVQQSTSIIFYENLGFIRLLSYINNDLLRDFSHQYLAKLEKYDIENETDLVHTLTIYCAKNGDISRTAEDLYIHQNTLRQRIKKIETILEMDLNNYTNLVNIILSLQISRDINDY